MLFGNCGSCCFHAALEPRRAALRSAGGSSSHEPPRATCGYGFVALIHGFSAVAATNCLYPSASYWSKHHSITFPCMSCNPHGFGFFVPTFWYLKSLFSAYYAYSSNFFV